MRCSFCFFIFELMQRRYSVGDSLRWDRGKIGSCQHRGASQNEVLLLLYIFELMQRRYSVGDSLRWDRGKMGRCQHREAVALTPEKMKKCDSHV